MNVITNGRARLAIARRLNATIFGVAEPGFLPFVDANGSRPVVIALPNDSVREIFDKLTRHYPSGANVVTVINGQLVTVVVWRSDLEAPFGYRDGDWAIPPETNLRTVINVLQATGYAIRCRPQSPGFDADFLAADLLAA